MEKMAICSEILKVCIINMFSYYIYLKITNIKNNDKVKTIFVILCNVNIGIIHLICRKYMNSLSTMIFSIVLFGIILNRYVIKNSRFNYIVIYTFSCVVSYLTYLMSTIISGVLILIVMPEIKSSNPISLILIPMIGIIILISLFKIKRLRHGINFFINLEIGNSLLKFIIVFFMLTIAIFCILQNKNNSMFNIFIIIQTVIVAILICIWIKSQITKTYKSKMRDRTIEIQKTEIDEKNKILEEVKEENLNFATTIHKYNKKISALEYIIKNRLEQETNTEFANELAIILKETKETAENFAKETKIKTNKLPETNVPGIDTMLKYMQEEARKKNINFDVKLNTNINSLLENTISKDKFETLIGDHLKDAIIAVDASQNTYKSILVTMGLEEGIYEFSVYDTGIEFEIETLLKLGEEQITTHKETGGSGIGFMTTFETLKECKASLIIEEYNPETTSYTKCITIRFDGKNKYKIYSYRANKIKEQKHKRKITIEELK